MLASAPATAQCTGDCNTDQKVAINELILGVNIALDLQPVSACQAFANAQNKVDIAQLIKGVNNALSGCPVGTITPTPTGGSSTPTPTPTTGLPCPLAAGKYTITQVAGGTLQVSSLSPFPFPAGGFVVEDVSAATQPDCVHSTVVPFPGGFHAPTFCVPALGFSVIVAQTGCGIGQIDSNGGSDYTVTELGDTSDTSGPCNLPQNCSNHDDSIRVNLTVGDGTPDTCSGSGKANALVAIPVLTTTWLEHATPGQCPAVDGTYDPGKGDALVSQFPQILDFTTDTTTTKFMDLDNDGCSLAGAGPERGFTANGVCLDLDAKTLTTVAAGTIGSSGAPLFDLAFLSKLPNTFNGPEASLGATCASPPLINFNGTVDRCLHP